jgi:biofilm protein TabA
MIIDALAHCAPYEQLHPLFPQAFAWLRQLAAQSDLPEGELELDAERIRASVTRCDGKPAAEARAETHRRYIDIQYVVEGADRIGWMPVSDCHQPGGYSTEKDVEFYADRPDLWFDLAAGQFAVFFPDDAHAPMANEGKPIVKIVIKVAV